MNVILSRSCSYRRLSFESCYKREERKKKRAGPTNRESWMLNMHAWNLHSTCTCSAPPVTYIGRLSQTFYARLAHLLSIKRQTRYAATMGLIQCKISFSLMRAAIMCFRGAQSSANHASMQIEPVTASSGCHRRFYLLITTYLIHSTTHDI